MSRIPLTPDHERIFEAALRLLMYRNGPGFSWADTEVRTCVRFALDLDTEVRQALCPTDIEGD